MDILARLGVKPVQCIPDKPKVTNTMTSHRLSSALLSASLMTLGFMISGCTVEDGNSETETQAKEITITDESTENTVSNNGLYDLKVSANGKVLKVEDDLNEITITGDGNTLTLQDDTLIKKITITGDSNVVQAKDDYSYRVTTILTTGLSNLVVTGSYGTWTDTQSENPSGKNTVTTTDQN